MDDFQTIVRQAQLAETRREAFDELVKRFRGMAYQQAYVTLRDTQLAEDAVQDAFLTAYLRIEQLREPAAFPAWLRRIVLTQCDRLIRGKQLTYESLDNSYDLAADNPSIEAVIEAREMQDQLQYAIETLPEHERAVTEGFYMQGESQKELAERLEIPVTTVKKRLQYAREHLRLLFGDIQAVVDEAIARVLNPPKPQPQPIYVYNRIEDEQGSLNRYEE